MTTFLVKYQGQWCRVVDFILPNHNLQWFDKVIKIIDNEYVVVKDRYTGITGKSGSTDLFVMKLFTLGKTIDELPLLMPTPWQHGAEPEIYFDVNGEKFEVDL